MAAPAPSLVPETAIVFHVDNPGEPAKAVLSTGGDLYGPFWTTEELRDAVDELREGGEIA